MDDVKYVHACVRQVSNNAGYETKSHAAKMQ